MSRKADLVTGGTTTINTPGRGVGAQSSAQLSAEEPACQSSSRVKRFVVCYKCKELGQRVSAVCAEEQLQVSLLTP